MNRDEATNLQDDEDVQENPGGNDYKSDEYDEVM